MSLHGRASRLPGPVGDRGRCRRRSRARRRRVDRWKAVLLIGWLVVPLRQPQRCLWRPPRLHRPLPDQRRAGREPLRCLPADAPSPVVGRGSSRGRVRVVVGAGRGLVPVAPPGRTGVPQPPMSTRVVPKASTYRHDRLSRAGGGVLLEVSTGQSRRPGRRHVVRNGSRERLGVEGEIRRRGYVITEQKAFPGVLVLKAVRRTSGLTTPRSSFDLGSRRTAATSIAPEPHSVVA